MGWFDMPNSQSSGSGSISSGDGSGHRCVGRWLRVKVALKFLSKVRRRGKVVGSSSGSNWATLAIVIRFFVILRLKRRGSSSGGHLAPSETVESLEDLNCPAVTTPLAQRSRPPIQQLLIEPIEYQPDQISPDHNDFPTFDHIKTADSPGMSTFRASVAPKPPISLVKPKIQEITKMPTSKQKLVYENIFIKDSNTVAYYNMLRGANIQLQMKERGGRKK